MSAHFHEDRMLLSPKPPNFSFVFAFFFLFVQGPRFCANKCDGFMALAEHLSPQKDGELANNSLVVILVSGDETQSYFQSAYRRINIGAVRRFPMEGGTVPSRGTRGWSEDCNKFTPGLNSFSLTEKPQLSSSILSL